MSQKIKPYWIGNVATLPVRAKPIGTGPDEMTSQYGSMSEQKRKASVRALSAIGTEMNGKLQTIISGGQAGADRAALDWAILNNLKHGGWCPYGRKAEDGPIDPKYQMNETESADYRQRTRQNGLESDGTLIVNIGELDGGSLETAKMAESLGKPCHVVQLDSEMTEESVQRLLDWLRSESIATLNVAGPRESKRPGIYLLTLSFLDRAFASVVA